MGSVNPTIIGVIKTVAIDASEAVRLTAKTRHQMHDCSTVMGQNKLTHTPKVVAIPLPPRKEENSGNRCPIMAAKAQNDCSVLESCKREQGKSANMPFPASPTRVNRAPLREPMRSTLVVPGLPEPFFRGSGMFSAWQTSTAVGIEPQR